VLPRPRLYVLMPRLGLDVMASVSSLLPCLDSTPQGTRTCKLCYNNLQAYKTPVCVWNTYTKKMNGWKFIHLRDNFIYLKSSVFRSNLNSVRCVCVCVLRHEFSLLSELRGSYSTWFSIASPRPNSQLPRLASPRLASASSVWNCESIQCTVSNVQ